MRQTRVSSICSVSHLCQAWVLPARWGISACARIGFALVTVPAITSPLSRTAKTPGVCVTAAECNQALTCPAWKARLQKARVRKSGNCFGEAVCSNISGVKGCMKSGVCADDSDATPQDKGTHLSNMGSVTRSKPSSAALSPALHR